jgi:hypothetical protein
MNKKTFWIGSVAATLGMVAIFSLAGSVAAADSSDQVHGSGNMTKKSENRKDMKPSSRCFCRCWGERQREMGGGFGMSDHGSGPGMMDRGGNGYDGGMMDDNPGGGDGYQDPMMGD